MKNKLTDLNNHLFAALERLSDEELTPEQVALECNRAKSVALLGNQITTIAQLSLQAERLKSDKLDCNAKLPVYFDTHH